MKIYTTPARLMLWFILLAILILGYLFAMYHCLDAPKSEYRRGLEDGLMAGRSEAYALLSKGSRANAENYWIRLKNEAMKKGVWYPLEMIGKEDKQ